MTKSEVEKAITVVMSDVIDECYRYSNNFPGEDKERVFQIVKEAESLMEELMNEVHHVKQKSGYSNNNPKIIAIKHKLSEKSMDYLQRLHNLAYY